MNKKTQLLMAASSLMLVIYNTGCSHTKQIGRIGDLEIHKVCLRGLDSPNITALATRNVQDNEVRFVETANGPGIGPAIIGAAGNAGGAALNGISLRPSSTRVNNNTTGGNTMSGSTSGGGNATGGTGNGGTGNGGNGGNGYGSAGATSSSNTQSSSYSQSDSWSGVIGSGNAVQSVCVHGAGCGVCRR